ncbi:MAG: hypothetical protein IPI17_12585 [Nitrosomonas sp.]|jgi:hypothetical protein|nr:hypothetical protein [Nitrosomonas sp.]
MFWKNKELIEFAEKEAAINAAFRIECTDALEKSSTTLLNILLGGAGGSLALAISLYDKNAETWLLLGTFGTSGYLFLLCGLLVWWCLWVQDIYPPANDPQNIYNEDCKKISFMKFLEFDLMNKQYCIDANRKRNAITGANLNKIRALASLTPVIIIACFIFA